MEKPIEIELAAWEFEQLLKAPHSRQYSDKPNWLEWNGIHFFVPKDKWMTHCLSEIPIKPLTNETQNRIMTAIVAFTQSKEEQK